jgi:thiol-disulfide isomerase/thioredoxin
VRRGLAAAAGALLALSACTSDGDAPAAPEPSALAACADQPDTPARGAEVLPDLVLDCPGGGSLDLGRAPGVPTVVNLWATWCAPCREELPLLQEFADQAGDAVQVVGVISRDGRPQAESFTAETGVSFANAFDGSGELMAELGLNALPHTYFLDADGGLAHVQVRPITSVEQARDLAAEHLGVQL